jgi:hypothetical protein
MEFSLDIFGTIKMQRMSRFETDRISKKNIQPILGPTNHFFAGLNVEQLHVTVD